MPHEAEAEGDPRDNPVMRHPHWHGVVDASTAALVGGLSVWTLGPGWAAWATAVIIWAVVYAADMVGGMVQAEARRTRRVVRRTREGGEDDVE